MKIACVQENVAFADHATNTDVVVRYLRDLKARGVDLVLFPEAFLTGYCVDSADVALGISIATAEGTEDPYLARIQQVCEELDIMAVVGFIEWAGCDDCDPTVGLFNSAALFEPGKEMRVYRKTHLPELGIDRFVKTGSDLPVFETRLGTVGILICFDQRHPEPARTLMLKGASIILLPTNWPEGAEQRADVYPIVRASENKVFYVTCNRVGTENGYRFIGRSKILDPHGNVLQSAGEDVAVLEAELDLSEASEKRTLVNNGSYAITVTESRRPELYSQISDLQEG